jgi:lysophospholipase L1-like esterase
MKPLIAGPLVSCILLAAACAAVNPRGSDGAVTQAAVAQPAAAEYVAMGSSFASGPGVATAAPDGPAPCRQSSANYARLVAQRLHLSLLDNTCAGATMAHVLRGGQHGRAAQVEGITPATKLVTVTIGGNDIGFMSNLAAWSCAQKPEILPVEWRAPVCSAGRSDDAVDAGLGQLAVQFDELATEVRRRSPQARLVFVDYSTVLPDAGHCPDRLPITDEQLQRGRTMERRLAEVTAAAARRNGALLVRASQATHGHDVCAAEPWVWSWVFPATLTEWAPGAYHPTEKAMQAIAEAIVGAL